MYTILQIIPAENNVYVINEKRDIGLYRVEYRDSRYKVVAWALVNRNEIVSVEPMILSTRGLIVFQSESTWEIIRV